MKILFGSIITNGRGKIGGQFVKRLANGHSLNNLPRTKSKKALLLNSTLSILTPIFQRWKSISSYDRALWATKASGYPVVDKFGNPKYLTGRQLFIKCSAQGWFYTQDYVAPSSFNPTVKQLTVSVGFVEYDADTMNFDFSGIDYDARVYVRVNRVANLAITPRFINSKIITAQNVDITTPLNIFPYIQAHFGAVGNDAIYNVSFVFFNTSGLLSAPQSFVLASNP